MTPLLEVHGLSKAFGGESVLQDISLRLEGAETLAVVGRSGCGKTTLLKILAGLESADAGSVTLAGEALDPLPPQRRGVLYLYQEALLFPHLDVTANLAFGLEVRGRSKGEIRPRVEQMLEELGLSEHAHKAPHQLSGGQRQRVAFGRALLVEPKLLLLDEPFGALDTDTRARMQQLFRQVAEQRQLPALFVTHDLKEAIKMGHRVGHLEKGRFRVFDSLQQLVHDPRLGVKEEMDFWIRLERQAEAPSAVPPEEPPETPSEASPGVQAPEPQTPELQAPELQTSQGKAPSASSLDSSAPTTPAKASS
ncbi:MAG: ABC transporter ATP-binding protein [Acidobacteriota bacterium]